MMGTREALDVYQEVKFTNTQHNDSHIGLCIFFLPGVKVNTFPVKRVSVRKANEDMNQANEDMNQRSIVLDNFLAEVQGFSPSPLLILIFGRTNVTSILDRLDSGLPQDTIIAGDSRIDFCFVWNGWNYDMVAFVFAKDERRAKGKILISRNSRLQIDKQMSNLDSEGPKTLR